MDYKNVMNYQEELVRNYKYKPLPPLYRDEVRDFYKGNLPDNFSLDGGNVPLFSPSGLKLCDRYNRIVIGDYGAYVEILPEDIAHENICIKKGQEYRENDARYSGNVKYAWLTSRDNSDIKIYLQKKTVAYADYVPGRYYISPYECAPLKVAEKRNDFLISRDEICEWLKSCGVFTDELADYYYQLSRAYGDVIDCAIKYNAEPYELEFWLAIQDVCQPANALSYEQYSAITYNLIAIGCKGSELNARLEALPSDIEISIKMGLECLEFPYEIQQLSSSTVRSLLKLSVDDLLCLSKFSKVVAGCKAEEQVQDVDSLINAAADRLQACPPRREVAELVK